MTTKRIDPRRLIAAVTTLSLAATGVAPTSAASAAAEEQAGGGGYRAETALTTPYLPRPTGPRAVGTTSRYLRDPTRPDPWVAEATARELMVSLWYPATPRGEPRAPYMTPMESELLLRDAGVPGVPLDVLSRTRTNAFRDAKPAGGRRGLPLIVLSPGFTKPRSTLTGLAEDLASHGYLVVAIEHTYESVATTFPDGRVTTCVACEEPGRTDEFWRKVGEGRAADVSFVLDFVLDELTGPHPKWAGASLIDPSRIAMAGHSVGGASSIDAMLRDSRVRAGIDLDGDTVASIPAGGLSRPFLFLGRQHGQSPGQDATWDRDWPLLTGWKRWLVVAGAAHASFTDISLLAEQFGVPTGADLPAARAMEITRRYTRAFFDLHLRGRPQPLLNRRSPRYPEVRLCAAETYACD